MKRLLRAAFSYLPKVGRRSSPVEKELRLSWNGKPVAEVVQRSPSARKYDTLDITQTGNADGISK
jgi:hypothetical protein